MTQSQAASLLNHPAFSGLSTDGAKQLESGTRLLRYRIGQSLCEEGTLPAQMLVILLSLIHI